MNRKHQDLDPWVLLADEPGRGDPIELGHIHVHEHQVRIHLLDQAEGFLTVGCLTDNPQVSLLFKQKPQTLSEQTLVLRDDEFDRHRRIHSSPPEV